MARIDWMISAVMFVAILSTFFWAINNYKPSLKPLRVAGWEIAGEIVNMIEWNATRTPIFVTSSNNTTDYRVEINFTFPSDTDLDSVRVLGHETEANSTNLVWIANLSTGTNIFNLYYTISNLSATGYVLDGNYSNASLTNITTIVGTEQSTKGISLSKINELSSTDYRTLKSSFGRDFHVQIDNSTADTILDYGEEIPQGTNVVVVKRYDMLFNDDFSRQNIEIRVALW